MEEGILCSYGKDIGYFGIAVVDTSIKNPKDQG
jgi:hypothetical protein